ncbi:MAG: hypothetical protein ACI4WX_10130 [Aristaeellaceae bacterium]
MAKKDDALNTAGAGMTDEEINALVEERVKQELEKKEAEKAGSAPAEPAQSSEWEESREIFLPYATKGEEQFVFVSVNGRKYQVPRGRTVNLPLPLYERIQIMLEAEAKAVKYTESLPNEAFPTNAEAVRVG